LYRESTKAVDPYRHLLYNIFIFKDYSLWDVMQRSMVVSEVSEEPSGTIFTVEQLAESKKDGRIGALSEQTTACRTL
jgi:hypothetical protein